MAKKLNDGIVLAKDMDEARKLLKEGYVFIEPKNPDDEDKLFMKKED